jgi:hypothetical protein
LNIFTLSICRPAPVSSYGTPHRINKTHASITILWQTKPLALLKLVLAQQNNNNITGCFIIKKQNRLTSKTDKNTTRQSQVSGFFFNPVTD